METGRALRDAQARVHDYDLDLHTLKEESSRSDKALEVADREIQRQAAAMETLCKERDELHVLARGYKEELDGMKRLLATFTSKVCVCVCVYAHTYVCVCMYVYVHAHFACAKIKQAYHIYAHAYTCVEAHE
jgi:hypothetical protein